MKCVVTGAAGFIGSHLCDALLQAGHEVAGLDAFVPAYPPAVKERNLTEALSHPSFHLERLDLRQHALDAVVADADCVFHIAGLGGLLPSWTDFETYWTCNVLATQRLLDAVRRSAGRLRRLVHASSSSVYGRFASGDEELPLKPISPYGVTKLAGESLCRAYAESTGLPVVVLRYFSVYGPRQRPDMAYHQFIAAILKGEPLTVCGDGSQSRSNTHVSDCVAATIAAVDAPAGEVYNVGGGESASVLDIIRRLELLTGKTAPIQWAPDRPGDQRSTFADAGKMHRHLGWSPRTGLDEGLASQVEWQKRHM